MVCMEGQLENCNVQETMHISIQTGTLNKHEQGHQSYEKIMQQTFIQNRDNLFIFLVYEIMVLLDT